MTKSLVLGKKKEYSRKKYIDKKIEKTKTVGKNQHKKEKNSG